MEDMFSHLVVGLRTSKRSVARCTMRVAMWQLSTMELIIGTPREDFPWPKSAFRQHILYPEAQS